MSLITQLKNTNLIDCKKIRTTLVGAYVDPTLTQAEAERSWSQLTSLSRTIDTAGNSVNFIMSDVLLFIEDRFGEEGSSMFDSDDYERLKNVLWICRNLPPEQRREEPFVHWSHYREVVPLKSNEERMDWLSRVVTERLSCRELHNMIDQQKRTEILEEAGMDEDTQRFWNMFCDELKIHYTVLPEWIEKGRGAAEEELDAKRKLSFWEWWNRMKGKVELLEMEPAAQVVWAAAQENK